MNLIERNAITLKSYAELNYIVGDDLFEEGQPIIKATAVTSRKTAAAAVAEA